MLNFNSSGLLVPNRNIKTSLNEFRKTFVDEIGTTERSKHFEAYINYSDTLKEACGVTDLTQWINGSFVTKTPRPKDIDLVTFVDFRTVEKLGNKLNEFLYPSSERLYSVDAYILVKYPKEHPNYFSFMADCRYWMDKFDKTRRNNRGNKLVKGFVELVY